MEENIIITEDKNTILNGMLSQLEMGYISININCNNSAVNIGKNYIDTDSIIEFIKSKIQESINV